MKDFVYDGGVKILYGAAQLELAAAELAKLGRRVLVVATGSFVKNGHYSAL